MQSGRPTRVSTASVDYNTTFSDGYGAWSDGAIAEGTRPFSFSGSPRAPHGTHFRRPPSMRFPLAPLARDGSVFPDPCAHPGTRGRAGVGGDGEQQLLRVVPPLLGGQGFHTP
ncbi:hypothetical protein NDU88_000894 [Pleurodeles waltl]|uniref:Uncharacterized protein n=1 Tax=Pleurodeles waltl TaxID=8319 RepID=A0AAV7V6P3_PLEWA|nr:hypothetical protein NDU88_000894 [Pleurodeles waltl]